MKKSFRKREVSRISFSAGDFREDGINCSVNGVLDTKHYSDEINRSWIFRTVEYGHSYDFWKNLVSTLGLVGYDYVLSIEHEDSLMSVKEGLEKAPAFLDRFPNPTVRSRGRQVTLTKDLIIKSLEQNQ